MGASEKGYAGAAWTGARSLAALARDVHDALYTAKEAAPGMLRTTGRRLLARRGRRVPPAAAALFRHAFFARNGGRAGAH